MKKNYILLLFLFLTNMMFGQLVLNEVLFDPAKDNGTEKPGDANLDGTRDATDDEFLEFVNSGTTDLDITGYKIYDATRFEGLPGTDNPRHVIGDTDGDDVADVNIILPAGGIYVVFGGGDLTTIKAKFPNVVFEKTSSLSLTNNGEIITVTDADYDGNGAGNKLITFDDDKIPFANERTTGDPAVIETFNLDGAGHQSLTRYPATSGDFGYHLGLNGKYQSPGELPSLPSGGDLIINEIFARPGNSTGDANGDGNGGTENEFIEIVNTTNQPIDISGFKFFDKTELFSDDNIFSGTPRHIVPASTTIPANGVYVVFSGGTLSADFGNAVVETASSGVLSLTDKGDFMIIADANDRYVTSFGSNSVVDTWNGYEAYSRDPDITGEFKKHRDIDGVTARFSPGKKSDGTNFSKNLSVDKFTENNVRFYISNGTLNIKGNLEGQNQLKIYNILGKVIFNKKFNAQAKNTFDLPNISSGIYILNVNNKLYGNYNKKIIIE